MLLLVQPDKHDDIWKGVAADLAVYENCFIVRGGIYDNRTLQKKLTEQEAILLMEKMRHAPLSRIGVHHGDPMAPYASLQLQSKDSANFTEYITQSVSGTMEPSKEECTCKDKIVEDISLISSLIFRDYPLLRTIHFPGPIGNIKEDNLILTESNGITLIERRDG